MADAEEKVPYDETTTDAWIAAVVALRWEPFESVSGKDAWILKGSCQRCGHPLSKTVEIARTVLRDGQDALAPPADVLVACNCPNTHEGRPEGKLGCGPAAIIPGPKA